MCSLPGLLQGLRPLGQTVGADVHAEAGLWDLGTQMAGPAAQTSDSKGQVQCLELTHLPCEHWLSTGQSSVSIALCHCSSASCCSSQTSDTLRRLAADQQT